MEILLVQQFSGICTSILFILFNSNNTGQLGIAIITIEHGR